jgi:hypothetical protein
VIPFLPQCFCHERRQTATELTVGAACIDPPLLPARFVLCRMNFQGTREQTLLNYSESYFC